MDQEFLETASMIFQSALPDISPIYGEVAGYAQTQDILAHIIGVLPDPDPFLKKSGYSEAVLDSIMGDARVTTVVLSRKEATMALEYEFRPGLREGKERDEPEDDAKDLLAFFLRHFPLDDLPDIIGEILNAPLFGYVPVEIIYAPLEGRVAVVDIRARSRRHIKWNHLGEPRFYPTRSPIGGVPLPPGKFVFAQHFPEFNNPYGLRLLSRCYWPVFFKKAGWKFWAQLAESHGTPKLFAALKDADWANRKTRRDTLENLKRIVQDSVAVGPQDTKLQTIQAGPANAQAYDLWIKALNHEITLAIQGEALTTESGDRGARSLGEVEQQTSENRAVADRRIVKQTIDRILKYYTLLNAPDVPAPTFHYVEKEDLKKDRADRDKVLHTMGTRYTKGYTEKTYGFQPEDLDDPADPEDDPFGQTGPDDGGGRGALFAAAGRRRAAASQAEVDFYVAEQVRAVSSLSEEQIGQVVKIATEAGSAQGVEDNLGAIIEAGSDEYDAVMSEILAAAEMFGRQAAEGE